MAQTSDTKAATIAEARSWMHSQFSSLKEAVSSINGIAPQHMWLVWFGHDVPARTMLAFADIMEGYEMLEAIIASEESGNVATADRPAPTPDSTEEAI